MCQYPMMLVLKLTGDLDVEDLLNAVNYDPASVGEFTEPFDFVILGLAAVDSGIRHLQEGGAGVLIVNVAIVTMINSMTGQPTFTF